MKKSLQVLFVIALVLAVVGIARANPAWAGPFTSGKSAPAAAAEPKSIIVTDSGVYNVGGICTIEIEYKNTNLRNTVDSEVPVKESSLVPFNYDADLYYPGCHVVHIKQDETVNEVNADDGKWEVCFGARQGVDMKIYYYLDTPPTGERIWMELPSFIKDDLICGSAIYTGLYMPSGTPPVGPRLPVTGGGADLATPIPGSIQPPAISTRITRSGAYSVGGVCTLEVIYKLPDLSDEVYVELPTKDTQTVPYEGEGLIYLPGCHVVHYDPLMLTVTEEQGKWKICFAAIPGKETTIYYYSDDENNITPPWIKLPTTLEDGMACAPAMHTGVYAPTAK